MIRPYIGTFLTVEAPTRDANGKRAWFGRYRIAGGKWRTLRNDAGEMIRFKSPAEASFLAQAHPDRSGV